MKGKSANQASRMPMPNNPGHPESPPPTIPIPGVPAGGGDLQSFKCPKCGNVYNSKEELTEHMHAEHPSESKIKSRLRKLTRI